MGNSFAKECNASKTKYDNCFNEWYSEQFLKGKSVTNPCVEEWTNYKECIDYQLVKNGLWKNIEDARKEQPFENGGDIIDKK